ncbi:MAG: ECF transporter S component [Eubacteriaceae bacterium]|nr:ECF transporter S component [Eubacteriaceae bacterium]
MVYAALCIALGIVLPIAFHSIPNAGSIFLPMHIPVLLCGLICGWKYGLICGALTPILSSLMTGMPPMAYVPSMTIELSVYGFVAGLMINVIKTKNINMNIYISLILAMIAGRLAGGIVNALIFKAGSYSMQIWIASSFITSFPGIIIQLILIPILVIALKKAKLVEQLG